MTPTDETSTAQQARGWHTRAGWWMLFAFVLLGGVLEFFHGFKVPWYMDVSNETRRLMWTLSHTHGTLLGLVHIAFASVAISLPETRRRVASLCLNAASVLLPGGFFLGGCFIHAGDPGVGILAVPVGALALTIATGVVAASLASR